MYGSGSLTSSSHGKNHSGGTSYGITARKYALTRCHSGLVCHETAPAVSLKSSGSLGNQRIRRSSE